MKKLLPFLLILCIGGCKPGTETGTKIDTIKPVEQFQAEDNFITEPLSEIDFDAIAPHEKTDPFPEPDDTVNVQHEKYQLTFSLRNGEKLVLTDDTAETVDGCSFTYLKSYENIPYWLVRVDVHEGGAYLLIGKEDGTKIWTWGVPVFSPDGNRFICYSCDVEAGFVANGIQLFELENQKPELKWETEINTWGPAEVKWKDNHSLAIKKYSLEFSDSETKEIYQFGLKNLNSI